MAKNKASHNLVLGIFVVVLVVGIVAALVALSQSTENRSDAAEVKNRQFDSQ